MYVCMYVYHKIHERLKYEKAMGPVKFRHSSVMSPQKQRERFRQVAWCKDFTATGCLIQPVQGLRTAWLLESLSIPAKGTGVFGALF